MSKLHQARLKLRGELEAPPSLRRFGSGWISGVLGLVLGLAGFGLVLSLRAPGLFSTTELRGLHENPWFRFAMHAILLSGFALSALSLALRPGKILGTCGASVTILAALLGGSESTAAVANPTPMFLGLDFFICIPLSFTRTSTGAFPGLKNSSSRRVFITGIMGSSTKQLT